MVILAHLYGNQVKNILSILMETISQLTYILRTLIRKRIFFIFPIKKVEIFSQGKNENFVGLYGHLSEPLRSLPSFLVLPEGITCQARHLSFL